MVGGTVRSGVAAMLAVGVMCVGPGCSDDESSEPVTTGTGTGTGTGSGTGTGPGGTGGTGGTAAGGAGGSGGSVGGGGGAGGGGETATATWTFRGLNGAALDGVEACLIGASPANCATSSGTGQATLEVPTNTELAVRGQKTDYVTMLAPFEAEPAGFAMTTYIPTEIELADRLQSFGVTPDPSKGTVALLHGGQAAPGMTVSIAPASGQGPFYFGPTFNPLPQATELPTNGGALFANVDPGTVTASFAPVVAGCAFDDAAWGSAADSSAGPVEADALTGLINIYCQ